MARARARGSKSTTKSLLELVVTIAAAVVLAALIQAFVVKPYRIPSPSMVPTLAVGQRVLTNRLTSSPSLGDIVVFHPPTGATPPGSAEPICGARDEGAGHGRACDAPTPGVSNQTFIKRVVAGPGDHVEIVSGHVFRNGVRQNDPYIAPCRASDACNFRTQIVIPAGHYFMMGDNRGASDDSRFWGPVPTGSIIGVAFLTYWPPDRIGVF